MQARRPAADVWGLGVTLYEAMTALFLAQAIGFDLGAGDLPPATTEAVCGITREALTNTLRYAPGAPVRVTLTRSPDAVALTVDSSVVWVSYVPLLPLFVLMGTGVYMWFLPQLARRRARRSAV